MGVSDGAVSHTRGLGDILSPKPAASFCEIPYKPRPFVKLCKTLVCSLRVYIMCRTVCFVELFQCCLLSVNSGRCF